MAVVPHLFQLAQDAKLVVVAEYRSAAYAALGAFREETGWAPDPHQSKGHLARYQSVHVGDGEDMDEELERRMYSKKGLGAAAGEAPAPGLAAELTSKRGGLGGCFGGSSVKEM